MSCHRREKVTSLPSINTMLQKEYTIPEQDGRTQTALFGHRQYVSDCSASSIVFSPPQELNEPPHRVTPDILPPLRLSSPRASAGGIGSPPPRTIYGHQQPVIQPKLRYTQDVGFVTTAAELPPVILPPDMTNYRHGPLAIARRCHYHGRSYSDMTYHSQEQFDKSNSSRYCCPYCHKRFSRPSSLRTHTYSHTGEKPFICPVEGCCRRFNVHSNLRRHLRRHSVPAFLLPTALSSTLATQAIYQSSTHAAVKETSPAPAV
ncbi:hypothetical protein BX666DRAFT_1990303 [Dichotomocladium elegans]|nr:hypothetical protein BX666DRAFT_1990303 [Dichotomocladium elegans]